jgi:hypothetical protein
VSYQRLSGEIEIVIISRRRLETAQEKKSLSSNCAKMSENATLPSQFEVHRTDLHRPHFVLGDLQQHPTV